jgi:hypothetical protein
VTPSIASHTSTPMITAKMAPNFQYVFMIRSLNRLILRPPPARQPPRESKTIVYAGHWLPDQLVLHNTTEAHIGQGAHFLDNFKVGRTYIMHNGRDREFAQCMYPPFPPHKPLRRVLPVKGPLRRAKPARP